MTDQLALPTAPSPRRTAGKPPAARDPVREYVGDLAGQLAAMARAAGDETLAQTLEVAMDLAMLTSVHPVVTAASPKRRV